MPASQTASNAVSFAHPGPQPVQPELLDLLVELAATSTGVIRESIEAILDDYIVDWLEELRPLPYIPNLVVEVAARKNWVPELVEKLGATTIVEAMSLALQAARSEPGVCQTLIPQLVQTEELLLEASGVEPGEAIRSVMESNDCKAHAALLAALIAVKPMKG
ncbi:amino acid adenylation [Pyrolobus fumarii 1A]|uniref:Amino acid adenylation n=1 Tax=Pyrolobus fumarii (strain DSM 11204 / 1A) TaxID=694429 RepID=G0ECQ3_PYRF1|nr:hypothetical protein [Pyrolobus fumarii]AEM39623.1 amino acid adenylation [Pyrolobus fumarii 1A]